MSIANTNYTEETRAPKITYPNIIKKQMKLFAYTEFLIFLYFDVEGIFINRNGVKLIEDGKRVSLKLRNILNTDNQFE